MSSDHIDEKKAPSISSSSGADVDDLPMSELSEKRLVRKLDYHVLPLITVLHLVSFLYVYADSKRRIKIVNNSRSAPVIDPISGMRELISATLSKVSTFLILVLEH